MADKDDRSSRIRFQNAAEGVVERAGQAAKRSKAGAVQKGRMTAVYNDPSMREILRQAVSEPHVSIFVCEGAERVASQAG